MRYLVLLHVLSAIIGIGPTYFIHTLLGKKKNVGEVRSTIKLAEKMENFPKFGGTIAVVTGLILVFAEGWRFVSFWIIASLVLYVVIQVIVIGFATPVTKQIWNLAKDSKLAEDAPVPADQARLLVKLNKIYYGATVLATLLFIMMILKPFY